MEFCKYCGSILNDDGRCPWEDCPHNALLDAEVKIKELANKENTKPEPVA